jgi:hypothetical protein
MLSPKLQLPCPPYGSEEYWENVYQKLGPHEIFEWGGISFSDHLLQFEYVPMIDSSSSSTTNMSNTTSEATQSIRTNFSEVINIKPGETDKKILILGSGYSLLGEELVQHGWLGPILQVDVSSRAVRRLQERWIMQSSSLSKSDYNSDTSAVMEFLQDDATELNAIASNSIHAVIDKGLVDSLFCSSSQQSPQDPKIQSIMKSIHRVLVPTGGIFAFLSLSQPQFLLQHTISGKTSERNDERTKIHDKNLWKGIQVRKLPTVFMYRYEKQQKQPKDQKLPPMPHGKRTGSTRLHKRNSSHFNRSVHRTI